MPLYRNEIQRIHEELIISFQVCLTSVVYLDFSQHLGFNPRHVILRLCIHRPSRFYIMTFRYKKILYNKLTILLMLGTRHFQQHEATKPKFKPSQFYVSSRWRIKHSFSHLVCSDMEWKPQKFPSVVSFPLSVISFFLSLFKPSFSAHKMLLSFFHTFLPLTCKKTSLIDPH